MKHFSHRKHPLILKEKLNTHDDKNNDIDTQKVKLHCNGCAGPISSGHFYSCSSNHCNFFLHKVCVELPKWIEHPLHPDHSLKLFSRSTNSCCNACRKIITTFFYSCSSCNFVIDTFCSSIKESVITLPSHEHTLTLLWRPILSMCDACGTEHNGLFYMCNTCNQFALHRDCASLPKRLEHTDRHEHPLELAFSIPPQYKHFSYGCGICPKEITTYNWMYYCGSCRYFAHVNCITSKSENFMSILLPGRDIKMTTQAEESCTDLVNLPVKDEFVCLVTHFNGGLELLENKNATSHKKHPGHEHTLILVDLQGNEKYEKDSCIKVKWCRLNDTKYNDSLCNACLTPILDPPFYKCDHECNFILHKSCANLPTTLRHHSCHPKHTLKLSYTKFPYAFWCHGCKYLCNGFKYSCTNRYCRYNLDVVCASLPYNIKHQAHSNHILSLKPKLSHKCNVCQFQDDLLVFAFCCKTCDFEIHGTCAIMPSTVNHRYDEEHPLTLTYCPVKDHSDDYYCDICEKRLNPLWWYYNCSNCDITMHGKCFPTLDWRSRIKFGGILKVRGHNHPLISVPVNRGYVQCNDYVRVITESNICNHCGKDFCSKRTKFGFFPMGFKCLQCKFKIHSSCIYEVGFGI